MKRIIFAVCALAMALLMLAGCVSSKSDDLPKDTAQDANTAATEVEKDTEQKQESTPEQGSASEETTAEAKTVSPLSSGIDMEHLDNCMVAVSFDKGDAYVDDTGAMQLKVTVYTYDVYDIVDISMLQVGDQITICQQDVKVTTLERDDAGAVIINGGTENGGYELVSGDEGVFYVSGLDDMKQYYALGEATIPVSADFEFEDLSDPEKGTSLYYAGDFLTDDAGIEYNFVPNNTTITIENGYVTRMQRVYNP